MEKERLIEMRGYLPRTPHKFLKPLNLTLRRGDIWLVYGPNGSGKSALAAAMQNAFRPEEGEILYNLEGNDWNRISSNIAQITFDTQYGGSDEGMCYQMRWNQGLLDDSLPRVRDVIKPEEFPRRELAERLMGRLKLETLMDEYIISLSSGEFRRFQIAQVLAKDPKILIVKNPFIGLDQENRALVSAFLKEIAAEGGISLIVLTCRIPEELDFYTHLVRMEEGRATLSPLTKELAAELAEERSREMRSFNLSTGNLSTGTPEEYGKGGEELLRLENVTIRYGGRTILKDLSWSVRRGERWALQGANGSGKSTLLSLICADNPQSYSCNITLFGRRRGSGESIWDIKRNIGYLSPEMYRSYRKPLPVENIVASGLYDTIGLYITPKEEDLAKVELWMRRFGIERLRGRNFMQLSDGERRMALLARAFVKNPPLLILDEPFHGLDSANRRLAMSVIEEFCSDPSKSLIMVSHYKEDFPGSIGKRLCLAHNGQNCQ